MVEELSEGQRMTLGADKAYDTADFVFEMRQLRVTPQVSCRSGWMFMLAAAACTVVRIPPSCWLLRYRHAGRLSHEMIPVRQLQKVPRHSVGARRPARARQVAARGATVDDDL